MTVTLELKPELEAVLVAHAGQKGLSVHDYLVSLIEQSANPVSAQGLSGADRARIFEEWARSHRDTRPLSDEAISRESIYQNRG